MIDDFRDFFQKVTNSFIDGTFAKLTLAKTIGNTDLKNIYVRPIIENDVLKLELKFRFQQEETIEIYAIDTTCDVLEKYMNNPFLSALLFTTDFDLVYKLNKKRAVSVIETFPTFAHASPVIAEYYLK